MRVGDEVLSSYGSGDFRAAPRHGDAPSLARRIGVAIVTRGGRRVVVSTPEHTHFAGYRRGLDARSSI